MVSFQALPQELKNQVLQFYLDDLKAQARQTTAEASKESSRFLQLRSVCRSLCATINRLLPLSDEFQVLADKCVPLARLQLLLLVRKGSANEHLLVTAIREASELVIAAKGNKAPTQQGREDTWRTVCSGVTEALLSRPLSSVSLRNQSDNTEWMPFLKLQSDRERRKFYSTTALNPEAGIGSAAKRVYELVILTAARRGNLEKVRALLKVHNVDDLSDSALDRHGNSIHHCAAASGDADLFLYCFVHFKNAWKENKRGLTPMAMAANLGRIELVEEVCRRYSSTGIIPPDRRNPTKLCGPVEIKDMMDAAAAGGQTAVLEYLKRYIY
ncbi:uncharacterized protein DSM5745_04091 [Aspergillus mulundensis]|uniref:Uncharacterized protein n=1 Tax=Aspergillus mulundensis TaxID=1810919 RepID=A0A3D8SBQ5_9EURO|nr:hypothetical protein DSM5745_04091 [Aspergillus mulundensis]RDW83765.1 hypothetical protein DSM5745_04091 [Aspergillus mulundensis]